MRKILVALFALCAALPCFANERAQGFCMVGNQPAVVQGLNSTTRDQASYPACTVTVFLHGTSTFASVFSDNNASPTTLTNPFTANLDGSWGFYAAGGRYDVVLSGGLFGGFAVPFTLSDIDLNAPGGGGGTNIVIQVNGTPVPGPIYNFINGLNTNITNPVSGNIQIDANGGGSGGCGPLAGDPTSTNCGNNNLSGNTGTTVQTFGYNSLNGNTANNAISLGSGNGTGNPFTDFIAIGDTNMGTRTAGTAGTDVTLIGTQNMNASACNGAATHVVAVGSTNVQACTDPDHAVLVGTGNMQTYAPAGASQIVAVGNADFNNSLGGGGILDGVAIGDGNGTNVNGHDEVLIGNGNLISTDTTPKNWVVAIGSGALNTATGGWNDAIAIGTSALGNSTNASGDIAIGKFSLFGSAAHDEVAIEGGLQQDSGNNNIAIGNSAILGLNGSTAVNTRTNVLAIGQFALAGDTSGSDNIAIGQYAGANGWVEFGTNGNANLTGNRNVWLGSFAGPSTATQLSNTIAIGYQSPVTASNSTVIGNSSITSAQIYGVGSGCLSSSGGVITGTGAACGGSGGVSPGGTNGAIQYNASGSFGGVVLSGPVFGNGTAAPSAATSTQLATALSATPAPISGSNFTDTALTTVGNCVTVGTGGLLTSAACTGAAGGGTGAIQYNTGSGLGGAVLSGLVFGNGATAPTAATSAQIATALDGTPQPLIGSTLKGTGLTSGNCLQASTGGLVVDTGVPCGSGGAGAGITSLTQDVAASGTGSVVAVVKGVNGVPLSSLATGLLKNTTATGVPSIAVANTDYLTPTGNGSGLTALNASQLTSGTILGARLPLPTLSVLGGVQASTATTSQWVTSISTAGTVQTSQPSFSDITGTATVTQLPQGSSSAKGILQCGAGTTCSGGVISASTTGISGLTSNFIPKAATSTALGNSLIDEGVTHAGAATVSDPNGLDVQGTGATIPIFLGSSVTFSTAAGVTSATCTSGNCQLARGSLSIVVGSATTGTLVTVNFPSPNPTAAPVCMVSRNGGSTFLGIGHGAPSTTSFTITAGVSAAGQTIAVDYWCAQ